MDVKIFHSIKEIPSEKWDLIQPENFPFSSYQFLEGLESSNSIGRRTGWFPLIVTVWQQEDLIAASSLYLKNNSYGEYIFDWAWADAWQKSGLKYYPKITAAAPFTPATGKKILCKKPADKTELTKLILDSLKEYAKKENIETIHFLFIPESEIPLFEENDFTIRKTFQFHWKNENYSYFDDFLMALKQKKRKEIRRERKLLKACDLEIKTVRGKEVSQYSDLMYEFYLSTIDKKWSHDYLTPSFFKKIFHSMTEEIVLFIAFKNKEAIAATLNFHKGNSLFGRYWGCTEEVPNLHFELCYYQPIEYAIANKIQLFEAGAQGEHKIQRGFIPSYTYSAHLLPNHQLGNAVKDFINREAQQVDSLIKEGRNMAYK